METLRVVVIFEGVAIFIAGAGAGCVLGIAITGNIADLPAAMEYLSFPGCTASSIGTSGGAPTATGMQLWRLRSLGLSQAQVDALLEYFYTHRAAWTHTSTITAQLYGNTAPSGTYQYAASPSTGNEYRYALENDDDAEGFNLWNIQVDS